MTGKLDWDKYHQTLEKTAPFTFHGKVLTGGAAVSAKSRPEASQPVSEQHIEEIAESRFSKTFETETTGSSGSTGFEIPFRRRGKVLSGLPVGPESIVHFAFFRILQNLVGFPDLFEPLFRTLALVDVRMILPGQFAVGLLDVFL